MQPMKIRGPIGVMASRIGLNGIDYDLEFDAVNIDQAMTGIGSYEYWGSKGFDRGSLVVEDFDVDNLIVTLSDDGTKVELEPLQIEELLKDDKVYEAIEEALGENCEPEE